MTKRHNRLPLRAATAVGCGVAVLSLAPLSCSGGAPRGGGRFPVVVARAEQRTLPYTIDASGTVEPMHTVAVEAQIGGSLNRVTFREGDEVRAGQVLFEIDPRPYEAALTQALAALSRDSAEATAAAADAERYRTLVAEQSVTTADYEQKRAAAAGLLSTVRADSAAVAVARLHLEYATIRAPISGRTGSLLVHDGNVVRSGGTPLVTINALKPILVRFAVPQQHLSAILRRRGERLPITARPLGADAQARLGALSFVDHHVDSTTGTVLLKGEFANGDGGLWPGEFVAVSLELYVQHDALVIPAQAVMASQAGSAVFVVETGPPPAGPSVSLRQVTVERTVDQWAVIAAGLKPGEEVVTDGQLRLTPGAHVDVRRPAAPSPAETGDAQ